MRLIAILLTLLTSCPISAATLLSPAELQEDVRILRRAYETLHPGLYRYNTPAQMDASFRQLSADLSRPLTRAEVYLAFARFTSKVKCGHTYPNFFNQKKEIAEELFGGQTRVPFEFVWINQTMVITRNLSGNAALPTGTVITKINGQRSGRVLNTLLDYSRADGSNRNKREDDLAINGLSRFPAFDVFYPLVFPLKDAAYTLEVREPVSGHRARVTVPAWTLQQRLSNLRTGATAQGDQPVWSSSMAAPDTALLRMPTWALYNSRWKWAEYLDAFMDDLATRKVAKLIIDLRGNEGGLDCGNGILSHLISEDLNLTRYRRKVRYRKTPADLNPYLDTWDPSFKDWGADAMEEGDGFYQLRGGDGPDSPDVVKPRGQRYTGKVIVLMDASNSSATFQFEEALQHNKLGILVGQPAGGNLRGINGGAFFFLRLPKSGIEVDLPLIGRFPDTPQPDATLAPDVLVPISPRDIALGTDVVLKAALQSR